MQSQNIIVVEHRVQVYLIVKQIQIVLILSGNNKAIPHGMDIKIINLNVTIIKLVVRIKFLIIFI
jgi:hypothetical protein